MKRTKPGIKKPAALPVATGMKADEAIARKIANGAVRAALPVAEDRKPGVSDFKAKPQFRGAHRDG